MKQTSMLRWTIQQASAEFGINERTIRKRLITIGAKPGDDGCFSTGEVHRAICEHDQNRCRREKALADRAELRFEIESGKYGPIALFELLGTEMAIEFRERVRNEQFPPDVQSRLLDPMSPQRVDELFNRVLRKHDAGKATNNHTEETNKPKDTDDETGPE